MSKEDRRPILYKGEMYSRVIPKGGGGPPKEPIRSYDDARAKIISDIKSTREVIKKIPQDLKLPHEFVVSVKLDPAFSAKSYYPGALFDTKLQQAGVEEIGSRNWQDEEGTSKMLFVRATEKGLTYLEERLNKTESDVTQAFALDVRKLRSIDILEPGDQVLGLPEDWEEGRLEAVLHPFEQDKNLVVDHFMKLLIESGVDPSRVRLKQYESGVTFVSLYGDQIILKKIVGYNPLRMVHPLSFRNVPFARRLIKGSAPLPPTEKSKSSMVLGVFDGGVQENNPYTEPYVENVNLAKSPPDEGDIQHGTMVVGVALYGPINDYGPKDTLPVPPISVKNFRIWPTTNEDDLDLYEIIDEIEETIPKEKNIYVYNLSFGPAGPILDDHITRFTFACDLLTARYNVLFCCAVGNHGDQDPEYLRRIESPSDMVNGLSVGAYSYNKGVLIKAPYSSIGPGREGNKLKPDICAFGGCEQSPIHLLSTEDSGSKDASAGTSFACPIVASWATQLIGLSNKEISTLVARGLLIHSSQSIDGAGYNNQFGHGILADSIEDIVTCQSNSFTLIYQGELEFGKFTEFKIPWINDIKTGRVRFRWTSLVISGIDPHSPDDYTTGSTMITLYPHSNKYKYTFDGNGKKETKTVDLNKDSTLAESLENDGWVKGTFPISESGAKTYATEEDLRADMKWDTVDCRDETKNADGIFDPVFYVHALTRGSRFIGRKIKFALIVSIEVSDVNTDLYSQIVNKYDLLVPIDLKIQTQVHVKNR